MITEVLNNNLIEAMRIRIPDGTNLANVLMDIFYIGKEAVASNSSTPKGCI